MKRTLLILAPVVFLTAVWYAVRLSYAAQGDPLLPALQGRQAAPSSQQSNVVLNKSFSGSEVLSDAGSKAIEPAPGVDFRNRKGFVEDNIGSPASSRRTASSAFGRERAVDPDAPGNFLTIDGRRAGIERLSVSSGTAALDLVIAPPGEILPGKQAGVSGFTYEEELFRTKWGWAAFEKTGRAVREDAATANP